MRHTSDLGTVVTGGSTIKQYATTNAFLRRLLVPTVRASSSTVRKLLDSEHPHHLSAVDGKPFAGFSRLCGPASGDSFNLLRLVLLID